MAQIITWLLKKVASMALESIVVDFVVNRALKPGKPPVAQLNEAEATDLSVVKNTNGAASTAGVDPAVLLIAETIATALEQQGLAAQEVLLADGRARPNISILVVTHDASQAADIVDATVVPAPSVADEETEHGIAA
jgi:ABC-type iron transport system FetAB ATPase subunit